jgi:hypothetical protein
MTFRFPEAAPASQIAPERRGPAVARFCHGCQQLYPLLRARHVGRPIYGRDLVTSTCSYEGMAFGHGATWWEEAVEVLPAVAAAPAAA